MKTNKTKSDWEKEWDKITKDWPWERVNEVYLNKEDLRRFISKKLQQARQEGIEEAIGIVDKMGKVPAIESWNGFTHDETMAYNQGIRDVWDMLATLKKKGIK